MANQSGQRMGAKGLQTRRRLIDATVELLSTVPIREIRVVDIAARAGTSSATFYLYFDSVNEVVCAASAELSQSTPEIMALFEAEWTRGNCMEKAEALVRLYLEFWDAHRPLLRTRNLIAEEGDIRFVDVRENSVRPMFQALQRVVENGQRSGDVPAEAPAAAVCGTLLMMLERMGALMHVHREHAGTSIAELMVACAQHIVSAAGFPMTMKAATSADDAR